MKEARLAAQLSQEKLGVLVGVEESSASARMNQYERGKHEADFSMVERISKVLDVPEAFFYAKDDDLAQLIIQFKRSGKRRRSAILEAAFNEDQYEV